MSKARQLEILTQARGHLAKGWVANVLYADNNRFSDSPVCANGAIFRSCSLQEYPVEPYFITGIRHQRIVDELLDLMNRMACKRYPQVSSDYMRAAYCDAMHVLVNNTLGQQAALELFDDAIIELETEIARDLVESVVYAGAPPKTVEKPTETKPIEPTPVYSPEKETVEEKEEEGVLV